MGISCSFRIPSADIIKSVSEPMSSPVANKAPNPTITNTVNALPKNIFRPLALAYNWISTAMRSSHRLRFGTKPPSSRSPWSSPRLIVAITYTMQTNPSSPVPTRNQVLRQTGRADGAYSRRDQREKISFGVRRLYLLSSRSDPPIGGSRASSVVRRLFAVCENVVKKV
uniref:Uncharacterized protein n=1 Tax=Anopheles coluzzii TaxID=1518534 RepID=A0A8W7PCT1_ANOCL